MKVVFDASYLVPFLDPKVKGVGKINERLEHLLKSLDKERAKIIVPTPALCEVLVGAGDAAPQYLDILNNSARFKVVPFSERAAVEAAAAHRDAIAAGDKKEGHSSWVKVKFDRQIVAIAKVEGAVRIYSDDNDIVRFAKRDGTNVVAMESLPLPPSRGEQKNLFDE